LETRNWPKNPIAFKYMYIVLLKIYIFYFIKDLSDLTLIVKNLISEHWHRKYSEPNLLSYFFSQYLPIEFQHSFRMAVDNFTNYFYLFAPSDVFNIYHFNSTLFFVQTTNISIYLIYFVVPYKNQYNNVNFILK
jgi:hypothetical protein